MGDSMCRISLIFLSLQTGLAVYCCCGVLGLMFVVGRGKANGLDCEEHREQKRCLGDVKLHKRSCKHRRAKPSIANTSTASV